MNKILRRSIKFKVHCEGKKLWLDYVFADNEEEALQKALNEFDLDDNSIITVERINDFNNLPFRIG